MFCTKCGYQNDDNAFKCVQCGEILQRTVPARPTCEIPNYLAPAILVTLFCCLPLGIPAIVFAAQVNGRLAGGDIQGAMESSGKAKFWTWLSFGFGLGWVVLNIVLFVLSAGFAAHAS